MASANADARMGQRIQALRRGHPAMTSKHAADFLGVSEDQYLAMEAGRLRPTGDQIILLADLMNVPPSQFFDGSVDL